MPGLSSEVEHFLESVASVGELQASDAALIDAARDLSETLVGRGATGREETSAALQKLRFIDELRREIADAIVRIRDQHSLQVLGHQA